MDEAQHERTMRASDADRDRVAEVLRAAAADGRLSLDELDERLERLYAAKTYGELEPVVEDLPRLPDIRRTGLSPAAAPNRDVATRVGGAPSSRIAKAIFGGVSRRGQWVVPAHYRVKAIFGGVDLDLREARLETAEVTIESKAVFGGVNIVVPPDVTVIMEGTGIFGGFGGDAEDVQPPAGAPVVRVTGKAVFGGVAVMRKPPSALPPL
ncbi:MAG TPA: DUF1707 domain-containing protein [Jiangellales bacterium]|nr:DUF1707 domain-containing protein [Jiangellales bacterium]